ncbi:Eukaryotic translation initiation factor 2 subunit alpha [Porphyridium purpureum]|uniref:Eukaryotic translation initiation factor 2 subunit alpha n=1 Tax=Porphyridium purpureum TaxID=35688 RepID=A0A5J4Z7L0_PORPP|nr:Eukaryotic translation initiation factor 2 subunit alpha [Porphyridium purpureum]|eukprot:POR8106..scf295_1
MVVNLECRMYENPFPEPDDVVMVLVKDIQDVGAYVQLLEYNKIQGMIMLSELSRRRIRSVNRLLRVGSQEVVVVVRVDKEKGYIDLSKSRVTADDLVRMEEKWNKASTVHSIMRRVAELTEVDLEDLYIRVGWPLYRKFGHAYDAFRAAVQDADAIFKGLDMSEQERAELMKNIEGRLKPKAVKMRADFEVTCFGFEGIDAIKAALKAGEEASSEEMRVRVKLVAPPLYVATTQAVDKKKGFDALETALEAIKTEIQKRGGKFILKAAARTVSDRDDKILLKLMEQLDTQNREVDGDADGSGSGADE